MTYQGEMLEKRVRPLAAQIEATGDGRTRRQRDGQHRGGLRGG